MPFELKLGAVTEGLPVITLAGHTYCVPRLRLRERIAIAQLAPKVKALATRKDQTPTAMMTTVVQTR